MATWETSLLLAVVLAYMTWVMLTDGDDDGTV